VLVDALGALPPGYGLTFCAAWVRDPRHVVAVWDINAEHQTTRGRSLGWERVQLRVLDADGNVVRQIDVARRSGIWHIAVPQPGMSVRLAIGFRLDDGRFETVSRSHLVRLPPNEPIGAGEFEISADLPTLLDRRALLRSEPPPRPGSAPTGRESAAWRLHARIAVARRQLTHEEWFGPFHAAPPPEEKVEPQPAAQAGQRSASAEERETSDQAPPDERHALAVDRRADSATDRSFENAATRVEQSIAPHDRESRRPEAQRTEAQRSETQLPEAQRPEAQRVLPSMLPDQRSVSALRRHEEPEQLQLRPRSLPEGGGSSGRPGDRLDPASSPRRGFGAPRRAPR
jgi:hypothetical protein